MSSLVFMALYRPNPGKEEELKELLKVHIPTLREEELITSRELLTLQAEDGTIIEIAEWRSTEAIEKAHQSSKVMAVWNKIGELSELTSLSTLAEAQHPFPNFKPL
ncbi:antibiotic biosynthesis monooxygenase [Neobacillus sp. MER 74]|uniref:antibiotic biosynthesis monooxygenase n=1 Tax=unclassified Neobacillus TaxID=2675272 RepID=UPI00203F1EEF|nr:antibiotic biosynthesis monooxygenase [Neobacillus sp. MER 74]MCM3116798.1 antibiotic biosynthesis monooxygenase [Neobacillus sp. MER 74]